MEIKNAGVLEKAAEYRAHADVVRHAGNARAKGADAAHDQIDFDAGLGRLVESGADLRFKQRIHLGDDARFFSLARVLRFGLDCFQGALVQRKRRLEKVLQLERLAKSSELHEYL